MAEQDSDEEKTEEATPRRLEKSREEGEVARSRELTTFMLLLAGLIGLWALGSTLYTELGGVMEQAFLFERRQAFEVVPMVVQGFGLIERVLLTFMPLFLFLAVVALVAPALLGGWLISAKALQPKISKLNPLKGIKRVLGVQALVELAKAIAKAALVGSVLVAFLYINRDEFMALMDQPIRQALAQSLTLVAQACGLMVLTLIVVILIDVPYQLWSHAKKLRMTKDEVKRENKETEGDPQQKAHIRRQQQAMARGRMMNKVPEADVIITNPSHYAVALQYRETGMAAPRVVAKGADAVAARIRDIAAEHAIPMLEAPPLARSLYQHVDLDEEIPQALYTAVAEVMAWAFGIRRAAREGGEAPTSPNDLAIPESLAVSAPNVDANGNQPWRS